MTLRHFLSGTSRRTTPLICIYLLGGGIAHQSLSQTPPQPIISPQPVVPPAPAKTDPDTALVISLLGENLSTRTFSFATVAEACSGKRVLPLTGDAGHKRVTNAIDKALKATFAEAEKADPPAAKLRSLDEAAKYFTENLQKQLSGIQGIRCDTPPARNGDNQQSGYPGLRIVDEESKTVFYLDPKLTKEGSKDNTFHFVPKNETLKITEDAVHLLVGIEYGGKEGAWEFKGWRLVDLSKTKVRLKAEFQATNDELYQKTELSLPE